MNELEKAGKLQIYMSWKLEIFSAQAGIFINKILFLFNFKFLFLFLFILKK